MSVGTVSHPEGVLVDLSATNSQNKHRLKANRNNNHR
jgi:hypothetical protein